MLRILFFMLAVMLSPVCQAESILVWGDSLSAGYGIDKAAAWPSLLAKRLADQGYRQSVANASISGETSAGGLARLPEALDRVKPSVFILELGANDGLQGLPLPSMRENLASMIAAAQKKGAKVLILGVRLPPNFGLSYTEKFHASYASLATEYHAALVPFFLEGVAARRDLFQADGLHPTAVAQPIILDTVWAQLKPLLKK